MNRMKVCLVTLLLVFSTPIFGQKMLVRNFDNDVEVSVDTFVVDDYIVIGHAKKGKKIHNFQGRITGIFADRNVVRVFDYARSTRFMSVVGKKIDIDNIIAVDRPDSEKMKQRQKRAIAATTVGVVGAGVGGDVGSVMGAAAVAGNVTSDFTSRIKTDKQTVKVEIIEQ